LKSFVKFPLPNFLCQISLAETKKIQLQTSCRIVQSAETQLSRQSSMDNTGYSNFDPVFQNIMKLKYKVPKEGEEKNRSFEFELQSIDGDVMNISLIYSQKF
jgi:hypothetical protein